MRDLKMLIKVKITGLLILSLFLMAKSSSAQSEETERDFPPTAIDSIYIGDYTNLLTTRAFLLFQNASLLLHPEGNNIPKIVYHPNANLRIGIAGFWRWFGLGLSIDNPFYKTDQAAYGKTTAIDLRINAYGRAVAGELFFQQYKGYYISSSEKIDHSHYILPDMKSWSVGVSGYWILNSRRFSIRAAFIQNERQKKSAGSFVIRPAFLYCNISSEQGIIPPELVDLYQVPASKRFTSGTFYSLGISPGYLYTLVFLKNLYLTAGLFPGIAGQQSSFSNSLENDTRFEFAFQFSGRFAIGYNSRNWFLGGSFQTGFNELPDKLSSSLANYGISQFRFWGGMRFDVFKRKNQGSLLK